MKSVPVVPDSSPLIILGKLERADLLAKLYGKVMVTPCVWEEAIIKGKALGARDASYLEKLALENRFDRATLTEREQQLVPRLREEAGIDLGEAEVLSIARSRGGFAILDDKAARALAVGLGIAHTGTAGVLFESFLRRFLSFQELIELLQELGKVSWISPELLAAILRKAGEVENR
ncbi:MAG: hypothetical protein EPO21_20840 [Chloroflexota bacterium]|nr:MAG: hypothetical protein EPO21_20840 [Chloroflexota bacterium]